MSKSGRIEEETFTARPDDEWPSAEREFGATIAAKLVESAQGLKWRTGSPQRSVAARSLWCQIIQNLEATGPTSSLSGLRLAAIVVPLTMAVVVAVMERCVAERQAGLAAVALLVLFCGVFHTFIVTLERSVAMRDAAAAAREKSNVVRDLARQAWTDAALGAGLSAGTLALVRGRRVCHLEWVDWFNNRRLLEPIGNVPPAEAEPPTIVNWRNPPHSPLDSNETASENVGTVQTLKAGLTALNADVLFSRATHAKDELLQQIRRKDALIGKVLPPTPDLETDSLIVARDIVITRG